MEVKTFAEQLLYTTVRIETETGNVKGCGTGFIVVYPVKDYQQPFIVTNKHVVSGMMEGSFHFATQKKDVDGPDVGAGYKLRVGPDFHRIWTGHPDPDVDVAVTPLIPALKRAEKDQVELFYRGIGSELFADDGVTDSLDALEEVVFVGYPNGVWDSKNGTPVIRKGITATPVNLDFQNTPTFLIDASVFPGSSGSPVLLYNAGSYVDKKTGTRKEGNRLMLLGIVAEVLIRRDVNNVEFVTVPTKDIPVAITTQMIDLGLVFKTRTIVQTIEHCLRGLEEGARQRGIVTG
ncbi:MAG TPA: serine protease [Symbiobacteriaceae bacterium]|nr:serine protease [Symbiobacteriaceae bacterium]